MAEPRGTGRVTFLVNAAGNFLGAAVAFLYFRLVDHHAATCPGSACTRSSIRSSSSRR